MSRPLDRVRRLTVWYVVVFALILLAFGAALYLVVASEIARGLDRSLETAVAEIEISVEIRDRESRLARGPVVDALDEIRAPGLSLYAFDGSLRQIRPQAADSWVIEAARRALGEGEAWERHETPDDRTWRLYARRFELPDGRAFVGAAVSDVVEVEDRYRSLLVSFGLAATVMLLVVGLGGAALARQASRPIEDTLDGMRRFLADAAHELRTPLAVLRGTAEVSLQGPREADEYKAALMAVERESERLGGIVEKMFLLARAEAGEWPLEKRPMYLDDALQEAVQAAAVLGRSKRVSIEVGALEEARALGDPDLIRQLFLILLDNAVRYTPAGGRVAVSCRRLDGDGIVVVADDGIGIPPAELDAVFERFRRGDTARGREAGAGLGLSIARWISDMHGAGLRLASEPGRGTTATATFPVLT